MRYIISALLLWASCGSPCQQIKTTRCNGSVVEACGANQKWQRVLDCAQVKAIKPGAPTKWSCAEVADKSCTCVPKP